MDSKRETGLAVKSELLPTTLGGRFHGSDEETNCRPTTSTGAAYRSSVTLSSALMINGGMVMRAWYDTAGSGNLRGLIDGLKKNGGQSPPFLIEQVALRTGSVNRFVRLYQPRAGRIGPPGEDRVEDNGEADSGRDRNRRPFQNSLNLCLLKGRISFQH